MIEVIYGFKIGDYELIIDSCEKTLQFVKGKKGVYSSHHQFFFSKKAAAQVAIGHYTEAEKNFKEASQYAPRNSSNDYLLRLYRTINALHSGNYQVAYDLYRKNKKCKFVRIREQFTLIEAYMCFLAYMGHIQLEKKFRIGKYLNETFKAQADKEGGNIIILIAELLVYFARNRGKFIDRVESINNYTYRNLQSYHTLRAKCFMKILCAMPSANFNAISLQRKARKHIQYLKEHPIQMGDNVAIEIIPFNHLLDMVMRQLKQKAA